MQVAGAFRGDDFGNGIRLSAAVPNLARFSNARRGHDAAIYEKPGL